MINLSQHPTDSVAKNLRPVQPLRWTEGAET